MRINIFIFLGIALLLTYFIGRIIEKRFQIPWIFAALLVGAIVSTINPIKEIATSENFSFLAQIGMYLLLFLIGFEINIRKFKSTGKFIVKSSFLIIFLEGIVGGIVIHLAFDYSWMISFLVSLSFATVGEAILVPILDKFKLTNTRLGQMIIGIGTVDDIVEIFSLIFVVILVGSGMYEKVNPIIIITSLIILIIIPFILSLLNKHIKKINISSHNTLFLITLMIFFLFLGIGSFAEAAALGAIIAGISIKNFIPFQKKETIEKQVRIITYGLFAPIFFLWVGAEIDFKILLASPLLILLVVAVSKSMKLLGSYIVARKRLGTKKSLILGVALSVRFSTSIIIIKILHDNNLIKDDLFSVIIASSIIFKFIIPVILSHLLKQEKEIVTTS